MLEIKHIVKKYDREVLKDINFSVKDGEIMALVGSNGSGKTTLMKIICGLIPSSSGEYTWGTTNISNMLETPEFFDSLSGYDNLKYFQIQRGCYDKTVIENVLKIVNLSNDQSKKYKNYSLGMKQKLAIALCLLNEPDFLVLDEPTNGVDAEGKINIRNLLKQLNTSRNVTMLISSHNLYELYNIATSFCFIKNGVIKEISAKDKIQDVLEHSLIINTDAPQEVVAYLENLETNSFYEVSENDIRVFNIDDTEHFRSELVAQHLPATVIRTYDIEDYFLNVMEGVS